MGTDDTATPFGHYALPPRRERIRARADRYSDTQLGRWAISLARKRAIRGLEEPFDVTVAPGVNARLYPSTNRCEKRAMAGVQIWDAAERNALREAIQSGTAPFTFLDIGANAGLYSLFASAYARAVDRPIRLIAVEPSATMANRLLGNAVASGADIEVARSAISDAKGGARLSDGGGNRGEAQLGFEGEVVAVETLQGFCDRLGVSRIDAMKVDIEGHDERALRAFFETAPETLHPRLMILELSEQSRGPLVELAREQNYLLSDDTALNGIFEKNDNV